MRGKKKMGKSRLVIFPTLFILLFVYGVVVGHYQIFPFDELSDLKFFLSQTEPSYYLLIVHKFMIMLRTYQNELLLIQKMILLKKEIN